MQMILSLVATSVDSLQALLTLVEIFLDDTDRRYECIKITCIRFGLTLRHNADCVKLTTRNGDQMSWATQLLVVDIWAFVLSADI